MNVLMIGGTGVLSSEVAKEAARKGFVITMINRGSILPPVDARVIVSDARDYEKIERELRGKSFDCVIDFLCYTVDAAEKSYSFYSRFAKQYIFISSCAVYDTRIGGVMSEDSKKDIEIWDYSTSKWECEQRIRQLSLQLCPITIVRPSVTYGDTRIPYGIAPEYRRHWTLVARILAGKPIICWNGGRNRCNMLRTEEFAVGLVGLIGNEKSYGEAFNICGDETPSYKDVIIAIENCVGVKAVLVDIPTEFYADELGWRKGELLGGRAIDSINSNAKLKKVVGGFSQQVFIDEGVKRTIDAYKAANYYNGIDWSFDAQTDRVVAKWCKSIGKPNRYKTSYVDYLCAHRLHDRWAWTKNRYPNSIIVRVINRIWRKR